MTRRHGGFTLLEVMVALIITGLVVTLAYAAIQGGMDTRDRLARRQSEQEALVTVEAMIRDALRHALPGVTGGPQVFLLVDRVTNTGRANDSITFLTRGVSPPYGTSLAWRVTLHLDAAGLRFVAAPPSGGPPVHALVPGISEFDVSALPRGEGTRWLDEWPEPFVAPRGAALRLTDGQGVSHPLVTRLHLETAP